MITAEPLQIQVTGRDALVAAIESLQMDQPTVITLRHARGVTRYSFNLPGAEYSRIVSEANHRNRLQHDLDQCRKRKPVPFIPADPAIEWAQHVKKLACIARTTSPKAAFK